MRPFRVSAYFAPDASGSHLGAIEMSLEGASGQTVTFEMTPKEYLAALSPAVEEGMTVTASYWSSDDLGWLESGLCPPEGWGNKEQDSCGEIGTRIRVLATHKTRTSPRYT